MFETQFGRLVILVLVSAMSHAMTLEPGDLLLTGTPEGVGPLVDGDQIKIGRTIFKFIQGSDIELLYADAPIVGDPDLIDVVNVSA